MTTSWLAPRYCLPISIPTTRIWAFNFRVNLRNSANSLLKISSQSLRQPISSVRWDDARVKCFGRHRCLRRSSKSDPRVFFPPNFSLIGDNLTTRKCRQIVSSSSFRFKLKGKTTFRFAISRRVVDNPRSIESSQVGYVLKITLATRFKSKFHEWWLNDCIVKV